MTINLNLSLFTFNFHNTPNIWTNVNKIHLKINLEKLVKITFELKHFLDTTKQLRKPTLMKLLLL